MTETDHLFFRWFLGVLLGFLGSQISDLQNFGDLIHLTDGRNLWSAWLKVIFWKDLGINCWLCVKLDGLLLDRFSDFDLADGFDLDLFLAVRWDEPISRFFKAAKESGIFGDCLRSPIFFEPERVSLNPMSESLRDLFFRCLFDGLLVNFRWFLSFRRGFGYYGLVGGESSKGFNGLDWRRKDNLSESLFQRLVDGFLVISGWLLSLWGEFGFLSFPFAERFFGDDRSNGMYDSDRWRIWDSKRDSLVSDGDNLRSVRDFSSTAGICLSKASMRCRVKENKEVSEVYHLQWLLGLIGISFDSFMEMLIDLREAISGLMVELRQDQSLDLYWWFQVVLLVSLGKKDADLQSRGYLFHQFDGITSGSKWFTWWFRFMIWVSRERLVIQCIFNRRNHTKSPIAHRRKVWKTLFSLDRRWRQLVSPDLRIEMGDLDSCSLGFNFGGSIWDVDWDGWFLRLCVDRREQSLEYFQGSDRFLRATRSLCFDPSMEELVWDLALVWLRVIHILIKKDQDIYGPRGKWLSIWTYPCCYYLLFSDVKVCLRGLFGIMDSRRHPTSQVQEHLRFKNNLSSQRTEKTVLSGEQPLQSQNNK